MNGWVAVAGRDGYLIPVRALGKLFRGKFIDALHRAWKHGDLNLAGSTAELEDPAQWAALKDRLYRKSWVVYAKPPFGGPEQGFRYLGRYTHRVAISNPRLLSFHGGRVTFTTKDYKDEARKKTMTLDAVEFLRRFLLHVLPKGLVRIRHYGLCAGRNVHTRLAAARQLLDATRSPAVLTAAVPDEPRPWWERFHEQTGIDLMACPSCKAGRLVRLRHDPFQNVGLGARASPAGGLKTFDNVTTPATSLTVPLACSARAQARPDGRSCVSRSIDPASSVVPVAAVIPQGRRSARNARIVRATPRASGLMTSP
jgi:hypothetical protein